MLFRLALVRYTSYVFNPLHRIRVTVSSSNFPRFSANPNNGRSLSDPVRAADAM